VVIFFQIVLALFLLSSCTTVGFHQDQKRKEIQFGEMREFNVCIYYEDPISEDEIFDLFSYWNIELSLYSLKAIPINLKKMERPGFSGFDILSFLYNVRLTDPCDRILYLKGRTWKDMLYEFFTLGLFAGIGIKLEIHGAVETHTNTRGYVKAKYISTLQLLFTSPKSTLVHEGYHLLGCGHQLFMESCYESILKTKSLGFSPDTEAGFFPSYTNSGNKFINRRQVNETFNTH